MNEDIFERWKGEVAMLRLQHEAEMKALETRLRRRHQRELDEVREEMKVGDWRNWRGV